MTTLYLTQNTGIIPSQASAHPGRFTEYTREYIRFNADDGWYFEFYGDFQYASYAGITADQEYSNIQDLYAYSDTGELQYRISDGNFSPMHFNIYMNTRPDPALFFENQVLNGYDTIIGSESNDAIYDSDGSDVYQMNGGFDTVVFSDELTDYTFNITNASAGEAEVSRYSVTGSLEVNSLNGVERVFISQGMFGGYKGVYLSSDGGAGKAYRMYQSAFDRTPDSDGLGYWISQMETGLSIEEMAASFIASQEFQDLYGKDVSNEAFITTVYQNVLHRDPDDAGLQWWLDEMNAGRHDQVSALVGFSESQENIEQVAPALANGVHYDLWLG